MKPEHQTAVLNNCKLPELYSILANNESYEKYINDLFAVSNEYTNRTFALSSLSAEAFLLSMRKQEEFNVASTMYQMYDCISEPDQKRFCEGMLQKKGLFEDTYKMMMDSF